MKELFTNTGTIRTEIDDRLKTRPLGVMSDLVVENLPEAMDRAQELAKDALESGRNSANQPLALLDAIMLEYALVQSEREVPQELSAVVNTLAENEDRLPGLLYEDLLYVNPLDTDPRLFSQNTEAASSERDFYLGHRLIEDSLADANTMLFHASHFSNRSDSATDCTNALVIAESRLQHLVSITKTIGSSMPKEHFAAFRQYLKSHPTRGIRGPSGGFSANIPTLELLLSGSQMPEEHIQAIERDMPYYPKRHVPHLKNAMMYVTTRDSLDYATFTTTQAVRSYESMKRMLVKFSAVHYGSVARHIPEVLAGNDVGTDGTSDVDAFLKNSLVRRQNSVRVISGSGLIS